MPGTVRSRASSRSDAAPPSPAKPWWRRHLLLCCFGLAFVVVALGMVVELLRIRADLDGGRAALSGLSLETMGAGLVETIDGAADRLDRAEHTASSSPFLAPLSVLPVVGDQLDAVRDLTGVAASIGGTAREAAVAIDEDLQRAGSEPAARLDLLDTVAQQLDVIEAAAADLDIGAEGRLVGPLATARAQVVDELEQLPERLDEARGYVGALSRLLEGPSRYLVLAANNAEMRGGAGMPLSGGVVTFAGGDVDFGEFEPLANRHVPAVVDAASEELRSTYHEFRVGQSWLQTAVSPNFVETAPVYAAMSADFPTGPVDGVFEVDAVALRELLAVIGPVELDGITYTADNVVSEVLNEAYLRFDDAAERAERQEVQGRLAAAIFDALKERDVELADLALGLRAAAQGRHLLAWSADPGVQALWDSVGATGELDPLGLMVTVQNIAANKLDWYIDPEVTVAARPQLGSEAWKVRLTVGIENPERERTSVALESARPESEYRDGMHRVLLAVYLPEAAYDIRSLDLPVTEAGPDGPLHMVGKRTFIPEGEQVHLALEFTLPPEHIGMLLLPAGRVRPTAFEVNGMPTTDAVAAPVFFGAGDEQERQPLVVIAALLALGAAAIALVLVWDRVGRPLPVARRRPTNLGLGDGAALGSGR